MLGYKTAFEWGLTMAAYQTLLDRRKQGTLPFFVQNGGDSLGNVGRQRIAFMMVLTSMNSTVYLYILYCRIL